MLRLTGAPVHCKQYTRQPMADEIGIVSAYLHPATAKHGEYVQYRPLHGPVHQRRARAEIIAAQIPGATPVSYVKHGTTVWIAEHWL